MAAGSSHSLLLALLASAAAALVTASPVSAAPVYDGPSEVVLPRLEDNEIFEWDARPFLSDPELASSGSIRCSTPLSFESTLAIFGGPGRSTLVPCLYSFTSTANRFCQLDVVFAATSGGEFTPFEVRFVSPLAGCQSVFAEQEPQTLIAALAPPPPPEPLPQPSSSSLAVPLLIALASVLAGLLAAAALYLMRLRKRLSERSQAIPVVVGPPLDDPVDPSLR